MYETKWFLYENTLLVVTMKLGRKRERENEREEKERKKGEKE